MLLSMVNRGQHGIENKQDKKRPSAYTLQQELFVIMLEFTQGVCVFNDYCMTKHKCRD